MAEEWARGSVSKFAVEIELGSYSDQIEAGKLL
jgi:hypothetical protein